LFFPTGTKSAWVIDGCLAGWEFTPRQELDEKRDQIVAAFFKTKNRPNQVHENQRHQLSVKLGAKEM
jgi:hypothetical protein